MSWGAVKEGSAEKGNEAIVVRSGALPFVSYVTQEVTSPPVPQFPWLVVT